jgi:hypothetical protein
MQSDVLLERALLLDWPLLCSAPQCLDEKVSKFNEKVIGFYDANLLLKLLKIKRKLFNKPKLPDSIKSAIRCREIDLKN